MHSDKESGPKSPKWPEMGQEWSPGPQNPPTCIAATPEPLSWVLQQDCVEKFFLASVPPASGVVPRQKFQNGRKAQKKKFRNLKASWPCFGSDLTFKLGQKHKIWPDMDLELTDWPEDQSS